MSISTGNGWIKFSIGTQVLKWNTGVANIFTSDPVDADGVRLEAGEALTAITVVAGDQVGDGYDTTYWTFGEGPVSCVLCTDEDNVIYNGTPYFRVEGGVVTVHPTQDQIESGKIGDGIDHEDLATTTEMTLELTGYLERPAPNPTAITGVRGTDIIVSMTQLLTALTALGIITDETSVAATATGALTLSGTAAAEDGT